MLNIDDHIILFIVTSTLMLLVLTGLLLYVIYRSANRQNQSFVQHEQLQFDYKNAHIKEVERVVNEISREVHDNVGQSANTIRMSLHVVKRMASDPKQLEIINDIAEVADQLIRDAHNISQSLNSEYIKANSLHTTLENLLDQITKYRNIRCHLDIIGLDKKLYPEAKLLVMRIAQEALHNIIKHSAATEAHIVLIYGRHSFKMKITDNGLGMSSEKTTALTGLGLNNMRERASLLGGDLFIESKQGSGCSITLRIEKLSFIDF